MSIKSRPSRPSFGGNFNFEEVEKGEKMRNFEEGLQIAADNKINGNNTWNLALIDYFADMTLLRDGEGINFQKASYTLDGCVKVYTSRIDSFESDTRKLLSGLVEKSSQEPGKESTEGETETSKQSKRRKQLSTTLEDNAALTTEAFELDFAADPLFQKTAADFDEGGAKGLLLSHLDISATGKIIFDASDSNLLMPPAIVEESTEIDMDGLIAKFGEKLAGIESREICPTFSSFRFNSEAVQDFTMETNRDDFYYNEFDQDEMSDYEAMEQLIPQQPFSPSLPQQFQDFGAIDDAPENHDFDFGPMDVPVNDNEQSLPLFLQQPQSHPSTFQNHTAAHQTVVQLVQSASFNADENIFKYFDNTSGRNWAGPEYWKSRSLKKPQQVEGEKEHRAAPKKKVKVALDFINEPRPDRSQVFAKSTTSISLPKSKIQSKDLHLLPDDLQFNSDRLLKLFLKPKYKIQKVVETLANYKASDGESSILNSQPQGSFAHDGEEGDYVYGGFDEDDDDLGDLPVPVVGFGTLQGDVEYPAVDGMPGADSYNDDFDMGPIDLDNGAIDTQQLESQGEIQNTSIAKEEQASTQATTVKIELKKPMYRQKTIPLFFAKAAKRVDVAKLKENLWSTITDQSVDSPQDEIAQVQETKMPIKDQTFTEIVSHLDDRYEEKQRKDISVAFCFICVLHLANENNLKITNEGMQELLISQS